MIREELEVFLGERKLDTVLIGDNLGLPKARAETILDGLFERFLDALSSVDVPDGVSVRIIEGIGWNLTKLVSGSQVGQMKL